MAVFHLTLAVGQGKGVREINTCSREITGRMSPLARVLSRRLAEHCAVFDYSPLLKARHSFGLFTK
jgi:hypothetical protein